MTSAAELLQPIVRRLLGTDPPVLIRFWDGSTVGPSTAATTIAVTSPAAIRHLVWAPNELGLGRAYVSGSLELEGDIYDLLALRDSIAATHEDADMALGVRGWAELLPAAWKLKLVGRRPPMPAE